MAVLRRDVAAEQLLVQERVDVRVGDEHRPRSDHVRLGEAVVPRRPARAVVRHAVVVERQRVLRVGRADRDRRRRVARRVDAGVADQTARRVLAVVAGRDDDDEPLRRRLLDRAHERIVRRLREDRVAEREVDDLHVQLRAVGRHVFDRFDDVARRALARLVEDLEAGERHVGRDAGKLSVGERAAAADQPGDERAVAVVVEGRHRNAAAREVEEGRDADVNGRRDAGVDERDADAFAGRRVRVRKREQAEQAARVAGLRRGGERLQQTLGQHRPALTAASAETAPDALVVREDVNVFAVHFRREGAHQRMIRGNQIAVRDERLADAAAQIRVVDRNNHLLSGGTGVQRTLKRMVNFVVVRLRENRTSAGEEAARRRRRQWRRIHGD